jgi:GNAT superfamily N-acetyltransferase
MEIIEVSHNQLKQYRALMIRALMEHSEYFRISVEDELNAPFPTLSLPDSFTLAATQNSEEYMGIISFQRERENRVKIRHKGLIFRMYVASEYSRKGVGRALIQEVIRRAKLLIALEQINLTLVSTNLRARQLYSSLGFETYGLERRAHKSGHTFFDEEFMVLDLNKT